MRGRPLIEWLLFAAVWALLLVPLLHVTGGGAGRRPVAVAQAGAVDTVRVPVWLRLAFSEAPDGFSVYAGGDVVWHETSVSVEMEQLVELVMGPGGPELELEAQWAGGGRRAVTVVMEPVEGRVRRAVVWGESARLRERMVFE